MGQKLFPCFTLCLIVSLCPLIYAPALVTGAPPYFPGRPPLLPGQPLPPGQSLVPGAPTYVPGQPLVPGAPPFVPDQPLVPGQLDYNFYARSCPRLANIVSFGVWSAVKNDTRMAASLLRMHFHDCIVNGCDASVLLDATDAFTGEKNAPANRNSLRGFEVIDTIKADVERFCPGTVSCADILALAARDAVVTAGGRTWDVPLGRRDGTTASEDAVNQQTPSPFDPLQNITAKFTSKGLDFKDVVVLSGAHTLGFARCLTFQRRLFDFKGSGKPDPTLDSSLLFNLQKTCPSKDAPNPNIAPLDITTPDKFDNMFYTNLRGNAGVLESDQALIADPQAAALVNSYSQNPFLFSYDFAASMVRLGNVGVLTGQEGQIRKICSSVN